MDGGGRSCFNEATRIFCAVGTNVCSSCCQPKSLPLCLGRVITVSCASTDGTDTVPLQSVIRRRQTKHKRRRGASTIPLYCVCQVPTKGFQLAGVINTTPNAVYVSRRRHWIFLSWTCVLWFHLYYCRCGRGRLCSRVAF